ncbi:hypothetical protein H0E87_014761, partial [Populus deltoides]
MGNMMIAGACMAKEDLEENYFSDQQGCSSDEEVTLKTRAELLQGTARHGQQKMGLDKQLV